MVSAKAVVGGGVFGCAAHYNIAKYRGWTPVVGGGAGLGFGVAAAAAAGTGITQVWSLATSILLC